MSGQRRHPHGAGDGGGGAEGAGGAGRGHRQCDDRVPLAAAHSLPPPHARHRPGRQPQVRRTNIMGKMGIKLDEPVAAAGPKGLGKLEGPGRGPLKSDKANGNLNKFGGHGKPPGRHG